ncbi:MAG TPA: Maf family protein [Pseudomonadales bacterium]|nr:Maf family protein [Pseudomonadales bacterium]
MSAAVYLASASPRRQELLQQMGLAFVQIESSVDESPIADETPQSYVQRVALLKAREGLKSLAKTDSLPVLGADTSVVLEGQIFGKPRDEADAKRMLQALSGRCHQVMTAVAVVTRAKEGVVLRCTDVTFKALSEEEISNYCQTGEYQGKAGAYAIQGRAAVFVEHIQGSYSGVVGLPLMETAALLARFGVTVLKPSV